MNDRYYVRDETLRHAISHLDSLDAYAVSHSDVDVSCFSALNDVLLYELFVSDDDAFNHDAYVTALRNAMPDFPDELLPPAIAFLMSVCANRHSDTNAPFFHLTDSTVDEITRIIDHAAFALAGRNLISRLIDERNSAPERPYRAPNVLPAYSSPRDVLACMTHLSMPRVAYVPSPDNDALPDHTSYSHLTLDPHIAFSDDDLRNAFFELIPHLADDDIAPQDSSPVTRSDF